MRRVVTLYRSSVGKKILMAVTGFVWFGFLVAHMVGNLKTFMGPEHLNEYAHALRVMGEPFLPEQGYLWAFRALMFVTFLVHMLLAWQTTNMSWDARSSKYKKLDNLSFSWSSRFMRWGGVLILVFVVFHILHLTTGTLHPDFDAGTADRIPDVYHNVGVAFSNPLVTAFYALAMVAVCAHLLHGVWSMFQSLGANHPRYERLRRPFAVFMAAVVFIGFLSVPVAVLTGILTP